MIHRRFNFVANPWFQNGIRGAVANLIISGSCLTCTFWVAASASLSSQTVSGVPVLMLLYAIPIFLIGFAAGTLSFRYNFGKVMMVVVAVLGSFLGILIGGIFVSALDASNLVYYSGPYPVLRYAGWVVLATTLPGILATIGVIILVGSIREAIARSK